MSSICTTESEATVEGERPTDGGAVDASGNEVDSENTDEWAGGLDELFVDCSLL